MTEHATDELLRRARRVLGELPEPLTPVHGRIVVDDGGDGSAARRLIEGCHRHDPTLQLATATDVSAAALAVVVVDAGADVGAALRGTVARHLHEVGRVALVCNRIDYFWQWTEMLGAYREALDPLHLCPVFAVASDAEDDPASGMVDLVEWLCTELAAAPDVARRRARLGAAGGELTQHSVGDWAHGAEPAAVLRRRRAELVAGRDRGRSDRLVALRAGVSGSRAVCGRRLQSRLRSVSAQALSRADQVTTRRGAIDLQTWLIDAIERTTQAETAELHSRLQRIRAVALLGVDAGPGHTVPPVAVELQQRPLPSARPGADDALVMVFGASTGLGVGRLMAAQLADVGLVGTMSTVATVVVGLLVALWVVRTRRRSALRNALRGWAGECCADARAAVEQSMALAVADVEPQVAASIARHYDRAARRAAAEVADIDARVRRLAEQSRLASDAADVGRAIAVHLKRV